MDFSLEYTHEQEQFAREVREWLDDNVPVGLVSPRDPLKQSYEQWLRRRELGRKLGKKGWLYPGYPKQYGGGGLDADHCFVLMQELGERHLGLPPYHDSGGVLGAPAIVVCGTEEQKKRLLPPILTGQAATWQLFTEPEAGTDEANQKTNALRSARDGGHFIVNGGKIFVGGLFPPPEQFLLLTRSDLEAPRHQNLAMFVAPANLPGISIIPLDLFVPGLFSMISGPAVDSADGVKYQVFFDDVRIPESCLIGGERDGWKVASATLEVEHGGGTGRRLPRNFVVERFLEQCRSNPSVVARLKENPQLLSTVIDTYISAQIERLFSMRNAGGVGGRYAGPQLAIYQKMFAGRLIADMAKVLGPSTLTDDAQCGIEDAIFEVAQRGGVCFAPGGTPEALKIVMSRALGIGR